MEFRVHLLPTSSLDLLLPPHGLGRERSRRDHTGKAPGTERGSERFPDDSHAGGLSSRQQRMPFSWTSSVFPRVTNRLFFFFSLKNSVRLRCVLQCSQLASRSHCLARGTHFLLSAGRPGPRLGWPPALPLSRPGMPLIVCSPQFLSHFLTFAEREKSAWKAPFPCHLASSVTYEESGVCPSLVRQGRPGVGFSRLSMKFCGRLFVPRAQTRQTSEQSRSLCSPPRHPAPQSPAPRPAFTPPDAALSHRRGFPLRHLSGSSAGRLLG